MRIITRVLLILCFLFFVSYHTYISNAETIVFYDDLNINKLNKVIVFENNNYSNTYNYSENIYINNTSNYIFVINEDTIDVINNEKFLIIIFREYGYLIISILGLISLLGLLYYLFKRRL